MSESVSQTPSTKKDNLDQEPMAVPSSDAIEPKEESKTMTLQNAIVQLEKLYNEKEEAVKAAQDAVTKAQSVLSIAEHDTLAVLRQLTPLQNKFLMNTIQVQKKQLEDLSGKLPSIAE